MSAYRARSKNTGAAPIPKQGITLAQTILNAAMLPQGTPRVLPLERAVN